MWVNEFTAENSLVGLEDEAVGKYGVLIDIEPCAIGAQLSLITIK